MNSLLTVFIARAQHQEHLDDAARRARQGARVGERTDRGLSASRWQGLTLRIATSADAPAIERLAKLDESRPPVAPVLLGVLMQRPVAAVSLADGCVIADPFTPTAELVELLRVRARQLRSA